MKSLLLLPFLAILFASCSKSDTSSDPVADLTVQKNIVVQSDWIITQFIDSGIDETSEFSGYRFRFNSDGTIDAVASDTTFTGSWVLGLGNTKPDDSGNISDDDKLNKMTISLSGNAQINHLGHKWLVDKISSTEIWLRDDNVASNEILRFGK
jgi:hypothetical protein